MRIVVMGNYQSTNLGDDMYIEILRRRYPDHTFYPQHKLGDNRAHFIIYGGGGVLRETEGRRGLMHEWRRKWRAPYCVLSVGSSIGDRLTFKTDPFPKAEFITVRDHAAHRALPGSELVPDLAWSFDPDKNGDSDKTDPEKDLAGKYTGIMLRHSSRFNSFRLVERCREEMTYLNAPFLFFSTYGERLGDRTLAHPTRAGFRSKYVQYPGYKPIEYLQHYRSVGRVIAMPLHGVIFAAIFGVPWATWIYDEKVAWLIKDIDGVGSSDLASDLQFNSTPRARVADLRERAQRHFKLLDPYLT